MKKIFLFLASACALAACDPVSEDISNAGHISKEELMAKTTVELDDAGGGLYGNVVRCSTSAPVVAKWDIRGKQFIGNFATKKMSGADVGVERTVTLTALCPDGTTYTVDYPITVDTLTDPLKKYWIYGEPGKGEGLLTMNQGDAAAGRFSNNEGKGLPFLSDEVYWGFKTLIFDVVEAAPADGGIWGEPAGPTMLRVMNGWWSTTYQDDVIIEGPGSWELPLTEEIAKDCAKGNGGGGKDLDILVRRGALTISGVYYEE